MRNFERPLPESVKCYSRACSAFFEAQASGAVSQATVARATMRRLLDDLPGERSEASGLNRQRHRMLGLL